MASTVVTPNIAVTPGAGTTPGAGGAGTPPVTTPGAGEAGGAGAGEGKGTEHKGPVQFEIDGKKFDLDLEEEGSKEDEGSSEFKFKDLDPIKEQHGDLHKSLMKKLSRESRYAAKFKTPEELDSHLQRIEKLSGGKGIDALEDVVGRMAQDLQGFRSGDAGAWATEAPEEFSAAVSKFNEAWYKADGKAWIADRAQAALAAFTAKDAAGQSALDALIAAHGKTSDPDVKKLLERTMYTLDAIQQNSQYKPDSTKLVQRQLAQRETKIFMTESDQRTEPLINESVRSAFNKIADGMNLTADERRELLTDGRKHWETAAKKNSRFMRELTTAYQAKDHKEIDALVKEYRGEFARDAVKELYRNRLSKMKDKIKTEAGSKTEGAGAGSQTSKPAVKWTGAMQPNGLPAVNFDYARMRAEDPEGITEHRFFVKGDPKQYVF